MPRIGESPSLDAPYTHTTTESVDVCRHIATHNRRLAFFATKHLVMGTCAPQHSLG